MAVARRVRSPAASASSVPSRGWRGGRRTVVRRTDQPQATSLSPPHRHRAGSRRRRLDRGMERRPETLHLDQDRWPGRSRPASCTSDSLTIRARGCGNTSPNARTYPPICSPGSQAILTRRSGPRSRGGGRRPRDRPMGPAHRPRRRGSCGCRIRCRRPTSWRDCSPIRSPAPGGRTPSSPDSGTGHTAGW
jgi:hypothetical protein